MSIRQCLATAQAAERKLLVPDYLSKTYWWAYVSSRAIRFWDRPLLINSVLFGNYRRLGAEVLARIPEGKRVVQLGSCYGDLIPNIHARAGHLTVVDCVPEQLDLARSKCDCETILADAADTGLPSNSADAVVIFFLLHEIPADWKRRVLAEAYRIAGIEGEVVICEFDRPKMCNPFGYLERLIFNLFEPYAFELFSWRWEPGAEEQHFGGLYRVISTSIASAILGASDNVKAAAESALQALTADSPSEPLRSDTKVPSRMLDQKVSQQTARVC